MSEPIEITDLLAREKERGDRALRAMNQALNFTYEALNMPRKDIPESDESSSDDE